MPQRERLFAIREADIQQLLFADNNDESNKFVMSLKAKQLKIQAKNQMKRMNRHPDSQLSFKEAKNVKFRL